MKHTRKEFYGSMCVTVSEHEVRLWVCNDKGQSMFRFKAVGSVYAGEDGVVVIENDLNRGMGKRMIEQEQEILKLKNIIATKGYK